ncbi:MAG: glycosyltransferase [Pseudomonadota bacterium]
MKKLNSIRVAVVTNIPTPYRLPVFEILAAMPDITLKVIYCSEREPDRDWDLTSTAYEAKYLNERFYTVGDKFVHANPEVFAALRSFKPDVVVGTGFNPTHLFAFLYAKISGCMFVPMTDGTLKSEQVLSPVHRWIRRRIYRQAKAFIAASDGGFDLYDSYGVNPTAIFKSHLCTNNAAFAGESAVQKKYDLIFSGRFGELKNPLFALEVAKLAALQSGRKLSLAFLGAGPLEPEMSKLASQYAEWVETHFLGFAKQAELPAIYKTARLMLFPTLADVWGVVANESLAAGVPVIVSPVAGCVPELVRHGQSGLVVPLEKQLWVAAVLQLLKDSELRQHMGNAGRKIVNEYTYANAAQGIADAVRLAVGRSVNRLPENNRAC